MRYVTRAGVVLEIGRVDRRALDALHVPEPTPPTRPVETWGGVVENVPDRQNSAYQQVLYEWRVTVWRTQLRAIAPALTVALDAAQRQHLDALRAIGLGDGTPSDFLRLLVDTPDQAAIVEAVYYQSTVTARGIAEAAERLAYTWRGRPLQTWAVGYTHGQRGALAVDMQAAFRSGLTWTQFCDLDGPTQSAHVAFWNLEDKLNWLVQSGN